MALLIYNILACIPKVGPFIIFEIETPELIHAMYSLLDACSGYDAAQTASFSWPNGKLQSVNEAATMLGECISTYSYSSGQLVWYCLSRVFNAAIGCLRTQS